MDQHEGWEAAIDWEPPRRSKPKRAFAEQSTLELWRSAFALVRIAATATLVSAIRLPFSGQHKPG